MTRERKDEALIQGIGIFLAWVVALALALTTCSR